MTKKNKLVSLFATIVLALVCVLGLGMSLSKTSARADDVVAPTPDVSAVTTTNLKVGYGSTTQAYFGNAKAYNENASWIIYDYTALRNGSRGANPDNNLHITAKTNGALSSGNPMPTYMGSNITNEAPTRVMIKIATGDIYYEVNGTLKFMKTITMPDLSDGQYYTVTIFFNGFEKIGDDAAFARRYMMINNLKCYDDLGNDLGIKVGGAWEEYLPEPLPLNQDGTDLVMIGSCGGNGSSVDGRGFQNATALPAGSRYLIGEWTVAQNNYSGTAYYGFSEHSKTTSGTTLINSVGSKIKIIIDSETKKIYKSTNNGKLTEFATESIAFNGYFYFDRHGGGVDIVTKLTGVKFYDEYGNDLGVKGFQGTTIAVAEPSVTAPSGSGITCTSLDSNSCISFLSKNPTKSEWIVIEYTTSADFTHNNNTAWNNCYFGISTVSNDAHHKAGNAAQRVVIFRAGKTVKLYYNTYEGYMAYSIDGVTPAGDICRVNKTLATSSNGTVDVWAGFCMHTSGTFTGAFENVKIYDGEGNDLGVVTSTKYDLHITMTSTNVAHQANRWLFYWDISNTETGEKYYPSYTLGTASQPIYIDGVSTVLTTTFTGYDITDDGVANNHTWVVNHSVFCRNGETSAYKVAPFRIEFEAGYEIVVKNVTYILDNSFYVYISGTSATVSDSERQVVSFCIEESLFVYGNVDGGRYQGNLYVNIGESSEQEISIGNILLKENGTDDEVVFFEYAVTQSGPISYTYISQFGVEKYTDIQQRWYLLPAGSIVGNIYVTDVDYVIQIDKEFFSLFRRDKVFTVNYENLQGETAPAETTFSYANDFEITLPSISDPEGFVFNGWTYNGDEITTITPGMFGSNVTVTANLSDGEKAVDVLTTVALGIQSDISMIFYVKVTVYDLAELSANFSFTYAEGRTLTQNNVEFVLAQAINDNVGIYTVTFDGILPQHMGDKVIFKVMEGETERGTYSASVVDYCSGLLAIEDPAELQTDATGLAYLKTLVCDLLEYGTAMQAYTAHDTANTPSALVGSYGDSAPTEFTQAEGIDDYQKIGEASTSYYWKSAALVYDYVPTLVVKFVAPESAELSVVINVAGSDDSYVETEFKNCGSAGDGLVVYELSVAFPPMMFDVVLEFAICDAEVQYGQTLEYSANAYIANVLATGSESSEETAILEAIYNYGVSAKAYNDYDAIA